MYVNILWEDFVMGFWSSFFGAGAAHVYNEMKKEGKEGEGRGERMSLCV